ncbi:MAG: APC family permease [Caulobacteraceae bacterium]
MFLTFSALSPSMSVFIYGDGILHMAGTGAAWAVLAGGAIAAIMAFLYAELGAAFPRAGGVYPSLVGILGPFWSFPYITMMMLLAPTLLAFSVLGFADYVRVLAPGLPKIPVALACLVSAAAVAMLRVRTGAILTGVFLCIELLALGVVCVVASTHPARSVTSVLAHPVVLQHGALSPVTAGAMSVAIVTGVFTCGGASWALYFGEELKNAPRRIGGVIGSVGLVAALLIAAPLFLLVLSLGDLKQVLGAEAPVADYMTHVGGRGLTTLVSVGLVIAVFNAIVAMILSYGRLFYATGRDGIWPRPVNRLLAHVHPGMRSPIGATTVLGVATVMFMLLGEQFLLILSSGENISEYLLMAAAVLVGRRRGKTGATFRTPLHPLIPILAIFAAVAFIWADWTDPTAGRPSVIILAVLSGSSLLYYRLRGKPWTLGGEAVAEDAGAVEA